MKLNCDDVRDLAPDLLTGRLPATIGVAAREHIAACAACAEELELARTVSGLRIHPTPGLHGRVVERIVSQRPVVHRRRMHLAMAAGIALALLGVRELVFNGGPQPVAPPTANGPRANEPRSIEPTGPGWMTVDAALNSGAATLDDLSEEQLRQLLMELES